MSCLVLLLLTAVIIYFGATIAFFLAIGAVPLAILCIVLIPLAILFTWRILYPWLVRMGRWSAQVRNIVFLAFVLTALAIGLGYIPGINIPTVTVPLIGIQVSATVLIFGPLFLFLFLLGLVVWVVRVWRRGWPLTRNFFWDLWFRIVALLGKIILGIPLGVAWFLYHPPLRWLIAALLFYLRGMAAAAAWLVYNPPLRSILKAFAWIGRLVGRVVAWLLYNPPIRWAIDFGIFILRLIARPISTVIHWIASWWPITGVKRTLDKGVITESRSYQDYKYA
jgi:hypothetical protein